MSKLPLRTPRIIAGVVLALVLVAGVTGGGGEALQALAVLGVLVLAGWLVIRGLNRFLFRVGRRLAFSYFLIGVLPIPMVLLLGTLTLLLLSGFFVGDVFRTTVSTVSVELDHAAKTRLEALQRSRSLPPQEDSVMYGHYRRGVRISGDPRLPRRWPAWFDASVEGAPARKPSFVALDDGTPTLAAGRREGDFAVLAVYSDPIEAHLSRKSGVWAELLRSDDPDKPEVVQIELFGYSLSVRPFDTQDSDDDRRAIFFDLEESDPFWKKPSIAWVEVFGSLRHLSDGQEVAEYVAAQLRTTPAFLYQRLTSGSAEVSTVAIGSVFLAATLLSAVYAIAVAMALFMIYALSRAVNSLTTSTEAVRDGDFSTRILVHRKDQLGELQDSFNQMSENLEQLVAQAAESEILEKELSIARDVQQSLIPTDLPSTDVVDFATLFEPSAAIGGDYFDVLPLADGELAIVVADVSGHGLPTGLRMAMLKAALEILVEEGKTPREVFGRLHELVRRDSGSRYFVTATICRVNLGTGAAELTNAGHPPTYLVRNGQAEEYLLSGTPLGTLGTDYGQTALQLEPDDLVVWLSDGLIERLNPQGEPFGYDRLQDSLSVSTRSAAELRDRLVQSIEEFAQGVPAEDDCTLVVMRYSPDSGSAIASAGSKPSRE